jgi:alpha-galactosidase
MKIFLVSLLLLFTTAFAEAQQSAVQIIVNTKSTSLVYKVGKDQRLYQSYLGPRLTNVADLSTIPSPTHLGYATFGTDNLFEPAIRVKHNDGNPSLELQYVNSDTEKKDENVSITHIKLKDPQYPLEVTLNLKAFYNENVIEQWVDIQHHEKNPITLFNYASSMLHFDAKKYWLTQFHGDWAQEMKMQESELTSGIKIIDSKLGTRAHMYQSPNFILSLDNKSDENNGEVIAGTLGWSGNFQLLFELDEKNSLRVISGINPFASEYSLAPGKSFVTPSFIFSYSNHGRGQASRDLHRWAMNYGVLDGTKPRLTLLNNWETTFFDFNEKKLSDMLDDTKNLGVDLFLLDDGWFGNKYPRNDDHAGLGDWQENKAKLANGLGSLVKMADSKGVKFGIWLEPEMVNPKSELYEKHPDWILKLPNRPEHYYRNQLVLDLTNPEVQEFVYHLVVDMLQKNPGITYIKWDCNRMMTNAYSVYLKNQQSNLYIDYVNNLYKVLERIRIKYPHLPIMLCSGGGARVDYGALRYFTEFWASDDTDPYERVFIQWGYSNFFPAVSVCNHITSWGKQSLKFRTDVAMMGKMGYDIQVKGLTPEELKFSQDALQNYKRLSDVIWKGDLYRLVSPYENERAVLMYVSENQGRAVVFSYTLNNRYGEAFNRVRLEGLDPARTYNVNEVNVLQKLQFKDNGKSFSGDYLMKEGLNVSANNALSSIVLELTEK